MLPSTPYFFLTLIIPFLLTLNFLLPRSVKEKIVIPNLGSDFPTNGFVADSTPPKPLLSLSVSLSLSLSNRPFVSRNDG